MKHLKVNIRAHFSRDQAVQEIMTRVDYVNFWTKLNHRLWYRVTYSLQATACGD